MIMFFEAFDVYKTESAFKRFCLYFNISTDFFFKDLQLTLKLIKTKVKPVNLLWKLTET